MPPSRMRAMNVLKELRSVLESGLSVCLEHESAVSTAVSFAGFVWLMSVRCERHYSRKLEHRPSTAEN